MSTVILDRLAPPADADVLCADGCSVVDASRALVVLCREPSPDAAVLALRDRYSQLVREAQLSDGTVRSTRAADLTWSDDAGTTLSWGRALWALGAAVRADPEGPALEAFERGAGLRSQWARPMAFAGLGAAEVLAVQPRHLGARGLLAAAARAVGRPSDDQDWLWPEERLAGENAVLPEVLLAAGSLLTEGSNLNDGMRLLAWLLAQQTVDGQLSVVPAQGRGPGERGDASGQQPTEVAVLADACARAAKVTGQPRWAEAVSLCVTWFEGEHAEAGEPDPGSALARLSIDQHARRLRGA